MLIAKTLAQGRVYYGWYLVGVGFVIQLLAAALGPLLGAYIFDLSGRYFWAFSLYSIFYVLGAFCFLIARAPKPPSGATP